MQASVLESKINKAKAQILAQAYPSIICDTFNCNSRAKFKVGINGGPPNKVHNLCTECAQNVLVSGIELGLIEYSADDELAGAKAQLRDMQQDLDQALTERSVAQQELTTLNEKLSALMPVPESLDAVENSADLLVAGDSLDIDGDQDEEVVGDGFEKIEAGTITKLDDVVAGAIVAPDLDSLTYPELQALAKEAGLKHVGVSKDDLIESLKEK